MFLLNDILDIDSIRIRPKRNEEVEGIGSGQILRAEMATPLWEVDINTTISEFDDGRRIRALLNSIDVPGGYFYLYDPIAQYPINDPDGSIMAGETIQIQTVGTDGSVSFANAPAGFVFSPGDVFGVTYSGRNGYFEIYESVTVAGDGTTDQFFTTPRVPAGVTALTAVTVIRPQIKVQIIPGQFTHGLTESSMWKMGAFTIKAVQKL